MSSDPRVFFTTDMLSQDSMPTERILPTPTTENVFVDMVAAKPVTPDCVIDLDGVDGFEVYGFDSSRSVGECSLMA
jgi:hypothetical protein